MDAQNTSSLAGKILETRLHSRCASMSNQEIVKEFLLVLNDSKVSISKRSYKKWKFEILKGGKIQKIFMINNIILGFEGLKID